MSLSVETRLVVIADIGSSALKIYLPSTLSEKQLLFISNRSWLTPEFGGEFIIHENRVELVVNMEPYAELVQLAEHQVTVINPHPITAIFQNLQQILGYDASKLALGISGANNLLTLAVSFSDDAPPLVLTLGHNPALVSNRLETEVFPKLRQLFIDLGSPEEAQQWARYLTDRKPYYLINQLLTIQANPQLLQAILKQMICFYSHELSDDDRKLLRLVEFQHLQIGDLQGWIIKSLREEITFGFTPQNYRSFGAANPQKARDILPRLSSTSNFGGGVIDEQQYTVPQIVPSPHAFHTENQLREFGVVNANDLSVVIRVLELIYWGDALIIMTDTTGKLLTPNGRADAPLPSQIENTPYLLQGIGTLFKLLREFLEEEKVAVAVNSYRAVDLYVNDLLENLKGNESLSFLSNLVFLPTQDGGHLYTMDNGKWQKITFEQALATFDRDKKDQLIKAVLLGTIFGVRQKVETILELVPEIRRVALMGGIINYGDEVWKEFWHLALSANLQHIDDVFVFSKGFDTPLALQILMAQELGIVPAGIVSTLDEIVSDPQSAVKAMLPKEELLVMNHEETAPLFLKIYRQWLEIQEQLLKQGEIGVDKYARIS